MSQLKKDVIFSENELNMANEIKEVIIAAIAKELQINEFNISVKISLDEKGDVMWGQIYADSDSDEPVWGVIDNAKESFAHSHGFPETLISVLPV